MNLNFLRKYRKASRVEAETLQRISRGIDIQLKTFTHHLMQIDTEYQSLHEDNLKIMELLKEWKTKSGLKQKP